MSQRVTQVVSEVLQQGSPASRLSQSVVEILQQRPTTTANRVTQSVIEVLQQRGTNGARVGQAVIEILRTVADRTGDQAFVRQSGVWKNATAFTRSGGVWKQAEITVTP